MYEVPEPCLLSHDPFGVSGNPTWKIGTKAGRHSFPREAGRLEVGEPSLPGNGGALGLAV